MHLDHFISKATKSLLPSTLFVLLGAGLPTTAAIAAPTPPPPDVILFYSDDVGYGDLGCYGATKVSTPNIDRVSQHGLRFTDAHSTASTCTPSRYSILTGQYSFRNQQAEILPGDAPLIIPTQTLTLPEVMKESGYATACIGKWHLGLGNGSIDWNGTIAPGPLELGFDESFIVPATPDRVPCVYVDGHKVVGLDQTDPISVSYSHRVGDDPTGSDHPEMLRYPPSHEHDDTIVDHISRIGWMAGGHSARWVDEDMATTLTQKAQEFITANKSRPFFIYFAINDIHVPHAPNQRFVGTSQCGLRGDSIEEMDWSMGQILKTLDQLKLSKNTLIIFSSDNGPIVDDGYADGSVIHLNGHKPAGPYRGGKYQIYEGGTRLPLITYWPGHIQPGVSNALVSQVDFESSLAALVGYQLPDTSAPDSWNVLPALLGTSEVGRSNLIEQSSGVLAIRSGNWKLIRAGARTRLAVLEDSDTSQGPPLSPSAQLFDLTTDPAETTDVSAANPEITQQLEDQLLSIINSPITRPH